MNRVSLAPSRIIELSLFFLPNLTNFVRVQTAQHNCLWREQNLKVLPQKSNKYRKTDHDVRMEYPV